jgi:hypothetical protein
MAHMRSLGQRIGNGQLRRGAGRKEAVVERGVIGYNGPNQFTGVTADTPTLRQSGRDINADTGSNYP